MKRLFKRDDGRVCILAPFSMSFSIDEDCNRRPEAEWKKLSMLCGGNSWLSNAVNDPEAIPTCLRCIAADRMPAEGFDEPD